MKEKLINWLIKVTKADTNKISDGYHTFEQLYDHRITLFATLCNGHTDRKPWKSKTHSDGSVWNGWFIVGIGVKPGKQISYHVPMERWEDFRVTEFDKAPKWDGHTPEDVIKRLKNL